MSTSQQDDTGYTLGYGFFILKWTRNVYLLNGITSSGMSLTGDNMLHSDVSVQLRAHDIVLS